MNSGIPVEVVVDSGLPAGSLPATRRAGRQAIALLWSLTGVYVMSLWVLVPLPLSYALPLAMPFSLFLYAISRRHAIESFLRLKIEFFLLGLMAVLSVLSLVNSNAPFRSFRIIFPSVLPFLLFLHLVVLGSISRERLLWIPRMLVGAAFLFSVFPFLASFVLPPLKSLVFEEYRLKCFFEISIQHSIVLAVTIPLLVAEFVLQKRLFWRGVLAVGLLLLVYTSFRAGSKTAMSVGMLGGLLTFVVLRMRAQSAGKSLLMFAMLGLAGVFLWFFGLDLAEKLEPEIAGKLRSIVEGGVKSYQSVQIRRHLWQVAIEEGKAHWLVGSGAGEIVLNYPHAHNLVLDYFKGIGLFGALAIVGLCLTILARGGFKALDILRGRGGVLDQRIFACYVGAAVYVLCNQMSDCFGPSTVGMLWTVYLSAVLAEGAGREREVRVELVEDDPMPGRGERS